jgi:hypothetical protein
MILNRPAQSEGNPHPRLWRFQFPAVVHGLRSAYRGEQQPNVWKYPDVAIERDDSLSQADSHVTFLIQGTRFKTRSASRSTVMLKFRLEEFLGKEKKLLARKC